MTEEPTKAVARTTDEWLADATGVRLSTIDGKRMISFSEDFTQQVNLLVPISQVVQVTGNFSPVPRVTRLVPGKANAPEDTYIVDRGKNLHALAKRGLNKLAELAQIEHVHTEWNYMGGTGVRATVEGRMRGPDGVWRLDSKSRVVRFPQLENKIRREVEASCSKRGQEFDEGWFEKRLDEEMEAVDQKCETKAWLRVVRALLSVKDTYTEAELRKPFFTIGYVFTPDPTDPNIGRLLELQYRGASEDLYGGTTDAEVVPLKAGGSEGLQAVSEPEIEPEAPLEAEIVDAGDFDVPEEPETAPEPVYEVAKPKTVFSFKQGPFAGKSVEEVVQDVDGRQWFATAAKTLDNPDKLAQALAWLSWAYQRPITLDTLDQS